MPISQYLEALGENEDEDDSDVEADEDTEDEEEEEGSETDSNRKEMTEEEVTSVYWSDSCEPVLTLFWLQKAEERLRNLRLGNDLSEDEEHSEESEEDEYGNDYASNNGDSDDEEEYRHPSVGDDMLKPTDNRNFKAYRDANKVEKAKKPKSKGTLDEDAIKDKVTRALKGQENRQTGKHHSRRNLTKGKEKRKNKDVIKHARNGNGSIFD